MNLISFILFFIFAALAAYFVFSSRKVKEAPAIEDSDKIKILNEHNFDHQIKRGIILVDFWAPWCMPCKMMAPVLNTLEEEVTGNASVGKLNVDQQQSISLRYGVRSIPTMLLFKNGQEINRFTGFKSKDFLLKEIMKVQ
jgi:thioredoxin 1